MQVIYKIRILVVIMALIGFLIILGLALTAWKDLQEDDQRMSRALGKHVVLEHVSLQLDTDSMLFNSKKNLKTETISIIF